MRLIFESIAVALSMYSRIPMPQFTWNKKNMRWSLAFLPLVGVFVAVIISVLFWLCRLGVLTPTFFAVLAVAVPVLLTGGLHMDGFCDTCDGLAAHVGKEERLKILSDPHMGAFGAIYCATLLLLQFGAWQQVTEKPAFFAPLLAAFVLSRVGAAAGIVYFPKAKDSGLAALFSRFGEKGALTIAFIVWTALAVLFSIWVTPWGIFIPILFIGGWGLFYLFAKKMFGGITGDLAGFFVCTTETAAVVLAAVLGAVL